MASKAYSKAPITEAIIDFQVKLPGNVSLADLERVGSGEKLAYPRKKITTIARGRVEFGERIGTTASQEHTGFLFISEDEKQIFQSRRDGFTLSRLAPYLGWDLLQKEARRLWSIYKEVVKPETIGRLAVRYINRFDVPGDRFETKDYFRTGPELSSELPQVLSGFFLRIQSPQPDVGGQLIINQTIIPPAKPNVTSVVLDIDLYRDEDVPQGDNEIWSLLEQFHQHKNVVFEACITARSRELIA